MILSLFINSCEEIPMKANFTRPQLSLAALFSSFGIFAAFPEATLAQSVPTPNAPDTPTQSSEVNSNNTLGNTLNPMDLIHNANLSRSRNGGEFADDTQRQLKKAADEFKQMQLQRLQQQAAPAAPAAATGN
jgi:hypothetical protein